MNTRRIPQLLIPLVAWAFCVDCLGPAARADIIIDIQNAFVPAGGPTGFVDVFISSDNAAGDAINGGSYFFEITPRSGTGVLQFLPGSRDVAPIKQDNLEQSLTNYVFYSQSDPENFVSERQDPIKTALVQSDGTSSGIPGVFGNNVLITTPKLLARLELTQLLPGSDGTFSIALKKDPTQTVFVDSSGGFVPIAEQSYSNFGIITSSVTAVPEPTLIGSLCLSAVVLYGRRRLRKGARTPVLGAHL